MCKHKKNKKIPDNTNDSGVGITVAEALITYSRYSYLLPQLRQALRQLHEAPQQQRACTPARRNLSLIDTLGPATVRRMVADCTAGMSQAAVARKYGVAESSVSRYVHAAHAGKSP